MAAYRTSLIAVMACVGDGADVTTALKGTRQK